MTKPPAHTLTPPAQLPPATQAGLLPNRIFNAHLLPLAWRESWRKIRSGNQASEMAVGDTLERCGEGLTGMKEPTRADYLDRVDVAVWQFLALREGSQMIDVRIESLPARRLLAVAHRGSYMGIGDAFTRLFDMAVTRGLLTPETVSVGIFYDAPGAVPTEELRSHACISLPDALQGDSEWPTGFEVVHLAGGEFAVGIHKGPYARLHESYDWLFGHWLPSSGREPADAPVHELYVNNPRTTPQEDLITHICLPLKPVTI